MLGGLGVCVRREDAKSMWVLGEGAKQEEAEQAHEEETFHAENRKGLWEKNFNLSV